MDTLDTRSRPLKPSFPAGPIPSAANARARVAADGKLYLCLFAQDGTDLRPYLGAGQEAVLAARVRTLWQARSNRYSELRGSAARTHRVVRMSLVGG